MADSTYENKKWAELGAATKIKLSSAAALVVASIVLGFVSFIILLEIPTSVIGLSGLWLSTALAIMGITSYFHNEMIQFQSEVKTRLKNLDKEEQE